MRQRSETRRGLPGDPCTLAIFGASGDLAKRKLFPALLNLKRSKLLPDAFAVVGLATSDMTSEAFRNRLAAEMPATAPDGPEPELARWLLERTHYLPGDFRSADVYGRLEGFVKDLEGRLDTRGNLVFYLATPPDFFGDIVERLGALAHENGRG